MLSIHSLISHPLSRYFSKVSYTIQAPDWTR